jgi:hypothetical protein
VSKSRLLSLVVAGVYLVILVIAYLVGVFDDETQEDVVKGVLGVVVWILLSLACIWFGDEMGEGLIGARFGLISSPSPGWAVKFIGWILLLLPVAMVIIMAAMR